MAKKDNFSQDYITTEGIPEITSRQVFAAKDNTNLIDVRTQEEWSGELGIIAGSELVSLGPDLESYIDSLDKEDEYVIVCRSGRRSASVVYYMQEKGFTKAYNLQGGMIAWNEEGLETASKP
ncbi:MAG: rhodanese-like domain-containing protein [Bdellovibrionota bacterium]|nr:rhodanese-like domain-containing protein [Bdellovibrionota bacterium]